MVLSLRVASARESCHLGFQARDGNPISLLRCIRSHIPLGTDDSAFSPEPRFLRSQPLSMYRADGRSIDLNSVLRRLLRNAIEQYGPQERPPTVLGVKAVSSDLDPDAPCIHWPRPEVERVVEIHLTQDAPRNEGAALFQIGHECIHLLATPDCPCPATFLEEGLAVHFSLACLPRNWRRAFEKSLPDWYPEALDLFRELTDNNAAREVIRTLRREEPAFFKMTADHIVKTVPTAGADLALRLCTRVPARRKGVNRTCASS